MLLARGDLPLVPLGVGRGEQVQPWVHPMLHLIGDERVSVHRHDVAALAARELHAEHLLHDAVVEVEALGPEIKWLATGY